MILGIILILYCIIEESGTFFTDSTMYTSVQGLRIKRMIISCYTAGTNFTFHFVTSRKEARVVQKVFSKMLATLPCHNCNIGSYRTGFAFSAKSQNIYGNMIYYQFLWYRNRIPIFFFLDIAYKHLCGEKS